jgi:hypothetical protein
MSKGSAAAVKSAAGNDDQMQSPAAVRRRRWFMGMRAAIIIGTAYKGAAEFGQWCGSSTVGSSTFLNHP